MYAGLMITTIPIKETANLCLKQQVIERFDLHTHSTRSDGRFSPTELVDLAVEQGVSLFALTDHDTLDGIVEASQRAVEHVA